MVNFYQLLGIAHNATDDQINAAYKVAAKTYHPDVNGGTQAAHDMFILIQKAREALLNPAERLEHDHATKIKQKPQPQMQNSGSKEFGWGELFTGAVITLGLMALFSNNSNTK
jgi:curved DNA-binding protein